MCVCVCVRFQTSRASTWCTIFVLLNSSFLRKAATAPFEDMQLEFFTLKMLFKEINFTLTGTIYFPRWLLGMGIWFKDISTLVFCLMLNLVYTPIYIYIYIFFFFENYISAACYSSKFCSRRWNTVHYF